MCVVICIIQKADILLFVVSFPRLQFRICNMQLARLKHVQSLALMRLHPRTAYWRFCRVASHPAGYQLPHSIWTNRGIAGSDGRHNLNCANLKQTKLKLKLCTQWFHNHKKDCYYKKHQLTQPNPILAWYILLKFPEVIDVVKLSGRAARVWLIGL